MSDEIDHGYDETQPVPPPLPLIHPPTAAQIDALEQLAAIRMELSRVNTTANRTPDAFVSWLRSKL